MTRSSDPAADSTPLQRALGQGTTRRRPTVLDAFDVARCRFREGKRVEMQSLAEELGVNRVTLYRWVGSREQLVTEILWTATQKSFVAYRAMLPRGLRAAAALTMFVRDVNNHAGMQQLLRDEPDLALTLLTSDGAHRKCPEVLSESAQLRAGLRLPSPGCGCKLNAVC